MPDVVQSNNRVLITWDGKILVTDDSAAFLRAEDFGVPARHLIVSLPAAPRLSDAFIYNLINSKPIERFVEGVGRITFSYDEQHLAYHVADETGQFLCREFGVDRVEFTRTHASEWESFLALDLNEFEALKYFLSERWTYRGSNGNAYYPRFVAPFTLRIGDLNCDLRLQSVTDLRQPRIAITHDGWKSTDLYQYRPLVYLTAYSSTAVFQQLRLCVTSIRKFGRFHGPIVVMTDVSQDEIKRLFTEDGMDPGELSVLRLPAQDFIGFVCSKYSIPDFDEFTDYQPILYLDPDIIVDLPLEPALIAIACSGRICAPAESWNQVSHHIPVGATLMRMDNIESRFVPGLNGGTIGFPALTIPEVRNIIDRIRHTIACTGRHFGRSFNGWADQEVMNYIAVKTDTFDSTALTSFVVHYLPSRSILGGPRGFVHFWGRTSSDKVDAMQTYLSHLQGAEKERYDESQEDIILASTSELNQSRPIMDTLRLAPNSE